MNKWKELVKEYRKQHGLTQIQLAAQFNIARNTVSRWETGACEVSGEFTWILAQEFFGQPDTSELTGAIRYLSSLQSYQDSSNKKLSTQEER